MTLQEIRNDVLARMGTDHEIQNSQIDRFINEGYHQVIGAIIDEDENYFGDSETIAFAANTQEYTPVNTYITIKHVEADYDDDGNYKKMTPCRIEDIESMQVSPTNTSASNPYYYTWGAKIGVLPRPTAATGDFIVRGTVMPSDLSGNSDVPAFPKPYHSLLVTWAIACMVEAVDENYLDGQRKRAEFQNGMDMLLRLISMRQNSDVKRMRVKNLY